MSFLTEIYTNYKLPITIIILLIIYAIIYANIIGNKLKEYIDKNWYHLKNKPWVIPFAGFFGKGKGDNAISRTIYNIYSFFTNLFKEFIGLFLKPFLYFIKLVTSIIEKIRHTLDQFRKMAQIIRNLFKQMVENTADKISNSYAAIMYFQEKLKLVIKKMSAMFAMFKQFGNSLNFLFYSYINGPIPRAVSFMMVYAIMMMIFLAMCLICPIPFVGIFACPICELCFDSNTPINTLNGIKLIKNLNINDVLEKGGKIKGIIQVIASDTEMYNYNNIIVSGSHLVYEDFQWKRVENSNKALRIDYLNDKILYCLITENNLIISGDTTFADYKETNNDKINYNINEIVIKTLNSGINIKTKDDINHLYYWGFGKNTIIETNSGKKLISNITINDIINNQPVLGLVKLDISDKKIYNYKGIIVSGSQAVCEQGIWLRVHQSKYSELINNYNDNYLYHVITKNNKLKINEIEFCDFCETTDRKTNEIIDNMVEMSKNLYSV